MHNVPATGAAAMTMPFLAMISKMMETKKELAMATISHQAVTRHQNQRTR